MIGAFLALIPLVLLFRGERKVHEDIRSIDDYYKEEVEIIKMYIVGEVINPGIYEIEKGLILDDLIKMAGGLTDKAGEDINLVYLLEKNETIYIKSKEDSGGMEISKGDDWIAQASDEPVFVNDKININTADEKTLCQLDGIGPKTANDIIEYRNKYGPFESIEDIMKVPGIKNAKFEKIKKFIITSD